MRTLSQLMHLTTAPIRAACVTLRLCDSYITSEEFLKKSRGSIALEFEVRDVVSHGVYPPEGPKRSVLIVRGSYPSSTRNLETSSTKGVDPQTKILGPCSGGKHSSASSALSILPRRPIHPSGCLRVNLLTIRKLESRRAIASSSAR